MSRDPDQSRHSVVVLGSAHMDLIARARRLPQPGESVLGAEFAMYPGGKAGNQAIAAAQQGARAAIIARVGHDSLGHELRQALTRKRVDVSLLEMARGEKTGVSPVLMAANGDYASIIVPGASDALTPESLAPAREALIHCSVLMLQLEIPLATSEAGARLADRAIVLLNAAPAPSPQDVSSWVLWEFVDVLIVNHDEARSLSKTPVGGRLDPLRAASDLRRALALGAVVVTLGPEGAALADTAGEMLIPGFAVSAVDTIGAGDAFAGAFAAALTRGVELRRAVVVANAAGALAVGRRGAYDAAPTLTETIALAAPRLNGM